jgi:catalase
MAVDFKAQSAATRPRLGRPGTLARLALISIVLAAVAGSFAYPGGWLSPNELTPVRFTNGFEEVDGVHPGFRRNHAKGLGVSGSFESNGNGVRLSKAAVLRPGHVPVIGRFSLGGGQPYVADKPDAVRGLGLEFSLPDGELWRTAMINLPVFPASTPEGFYEQMLASKPDPVTGKPDPARMQAFFERHPETVRALAVLKDRPVSSGFENTTFYGLNAFHLVNAAGDSTPVRWLVRPEQPFEAADPPPAGKDKNYLFDALIARISLQSLRWHMIIIVGQPGDPTNDPSAVWPEGKETVDVGTLTLERAESDERSAATDINFDPLVLPAGIAPSDDPFLSARSAVYSQSYTRRAGETKQPPAITPAALQKGGR